MQYYSSMVIYFIDNHSSMYPVDNNALSMNFSI